MRSFFRLVIPAIHHQLYVFWLHFHGRDVGTEWWILVRYNTMNDHCAKVIQRHKHVRIRKRRRLFFQNVILKRTNRYKSLTKLLHFFHFCSETYLLSKCFRRDAEVAFTSIIHFVSFRYLVYSLLAKKTLKFRTLKFGRSIFGRIAAEHN